ncbi:MAG TPA: NUDIX domain-containing protein [Candidatus Saccharimonadia bacterium]|nr:NUDIX domain-containing protein [Candidatus Saccharimonadia bacterium]
MDAHEQRTWVIGKAIVTGDDGRLLALHRSKTDPSRPLTWDLPGGVVEFGEDPVEATVREVQEEAGQAISHLKAVFVASEAGDRGYAIILVFVAHADSDAVTLSYEHDQYRWVTAREFIELDGVPDHFKTAVSEAFAG